MYIQFMNKKILEIGDVVISLDAREPQIIIVDEILFDGGVLERDLVTLKQNKGPYYNLVIVKNWNDASNICDSIKSTQEWEKRRIKEIKAWAKSEIENTLRTYPRSTLDRID